jgi:hypothetical protein
LSSQIHQDADPDLDKAHVPDKGSI